MPQCARSLPAADALLMPPVPDAAYQAVLAAAKSGRIPQERLDASLRRILQAKARLGLNQDRFVDVAALNEKFGKTAWQETAQEISDRGDHSFARPASPVFLSMERSLRAVCL